MGDLHLILTSFFILLKSPVGWSYPSPDHSNLHYLDEPFDLVQVESRISPTITAIVPPPGFVITERLPIQEETQTEQSFLRPVSFKAYALPLRQASVAPRATEPTPLHVTTSFQAQNTAVSPSSPQTPENPFYAANSPQNTKVSSQYESKSPQAAEVSLQYASQSFESTKVIPQSPPKSIEITNVTPQTRKTQVIVVDDNRDPTSQLPQAAGVASPPEKQSEASTRRPVAIHQRSSHDEDATQAYGVLESAALSLVTDEDQLAIANLSSNCSTLDTLHAEYLEEPILKPLELEEGVISDAKLTEIGRSEAVVFKDIDESQKYAPVSNSVSTRGAEYDEFGLGSEVRAVLEHPVHHLAIVEHALHGQAAEETPVEVQSVTGKALQDKDVVDYHASNSTIDCNGTETSSTAVITVSGFLNRTAGAKYEASAQDYYHSEALVAPKQESTGALPSAASLVRTSTVPSDRAIGVLAAPSTTAVPHDEETISLSVIKAAVPPPETTPSASDEAASLPRLPIQQDPRTPSRLNDESTAAETVAQPTILETTTSSNDSTILVFDGSGEVRPVSQDVSGSAEDGQVIVASVQKSRKKSWYEVIAPLMPERRLDVENIALYSELNLCSAVDLQRGCKITIRAVADVPMLKHGASYNIKSVADGMCLTAHKHRFLDAGVLPGSVTTEAFERQDNQIWDALETGPNEYWLMTQRYTVNEVTSVVTDQPSVPPKNFFALVPITTQTFIMKSTASGNCIESAGIHRRISFVPCDFTLVEQQWTAEFLYEEQKANLQ